MKSCDIGAARAARGFPHSCFESISFDLAALFPHPAVHSADVTARLAEQAPPRSESRVIAVAAQDREDGTGEAVPSGKDMATTRVGHSCLYALYC